MTESHDELLEAAVNAQNRYEMLVNQAKQERRAAFQTALRSTVTGREIAKATGLSESLVSKIKAGKY